MRTDVEKPFILQHGTVLLGPLLVQLARIRIDDRTQVAHEEAIRRWPWYNAQRREERVESALDELVDVLPGDGDDDGGRSDFVRELTSSV